MVTSDQQFGAFEEHLLAELKDVVATHTAEGAVSGTSRPARKPRRGLVLTVAAVMTAAAVAVVIDPALLGLSSSPAYAVQRDPDGSIRISVYDYRDPKGLQQRIEAFGVKAAVDYLPAGMTCQEPRADYVPADQMPRKMVDWAPLNSKDRYFKVHTQYIRPNQTFVYTVQVSAQHGDRIQRSAIRLANGPVAPCKPTPGDVAPSFGR
jgi:hypothetical protein